MNTRISAARRTAAGLLAALSLLLLPGCAPSGARDRAPVQPLTCTQPAALSGITPAGGAAAAVSGSVMMISGNSLKKANKNVKKSAAKAMKTVSGIMDEMSSKNFKF